MHKHGHSAMCFIYLFVILFWPMRHATTLAQEQCPSLSRADWDHLISFRAPLDLQQQARTGGWTFQRIEAGAGDQVNLDYYAVVVDRPPRINGSVLSPEAFLDQIRRRFGGFIARDLARFGAARPDFDAPWQMGTPGAVMTFTILPTTIPNLGVAVPAQVMLTESTPLRWIFSTGHLANVAPHPVNGNREFGVVRGAQDTFTFYTRGADTLNNEMLQRLPGGSDSVFGGGERIWEAFQEKVIEFVSSNGGHVSNAPSFGMRYCWSTMRPQHFQPTTNWLGQASQPSGRGVRVGRRDLDRILWVANATVVTNSHNYGLAMIADYVVGVFNRNRNANQQQIIPALQQVLAQYDAQRNGMRDNTSTHTSAIAGLLRATPGIDMPTLVKNPELMGVVTRTTDEKQSYEKLFSIGRSNSRARQVINEVFRPRLGAAIGDTAHDIVGRNPALQASGWITTLVEAADQNRLSDALIEQVFSNVNTSSRSVLTESVARLREIDEAQRNFSDFLAQQFSSSRTRQIPVDAAARRAQDVSTLAGTGAAVDVLSSLANITGNQRLSKTIATVGSATIAISNAVSAFTESSSNPGASSGGGLQGVGASLLSGNVAGAVFKIAGLFGLGGPSTDALILEQVRGIRSDLKQMNEQMNTRFDNIDRTLHQLNARIEASFDQVYREFENLERAIDEVNRQVRDINERTIRIEREVTEIQSRMVSVQNDLGKIQSALDDFDRRMQRMLQAGFGQQLVQYVDRCVGYREKHGGREMDSQWYDDCENVLYSWAVAHSANVTSTGSTVDSSYTALVDAIEAATGRPLTAAQEPAAGRHAVPNVVVWRKAADAYVQMAVEWPQHRRRIPTQQRVQEIIDVGSLAESAIDGLMVSRTSQAATTANDLYERLVTNYADRLEVLKTALKNVEIQHQQRLGYDMWGPADQLTPANPTKHTELRYCPAPTYNIDFVNMNMTLSAPPGIQEAPELRSARILEELGLATLTYCYEVYPGRTIGDFGVTISITANDNPVLTLYWITPNGNYRLRDASMALTTNWTTWKDRVMLESHRLDWEIFQTRLASQVEDRFTFQARAFYNEVTGSLRSGGGEIGRAGKELDSAKRLLTAVIDWAEPEMLDHNDAIARMLVGSGGLLDSRALIEAVYRHQSRTPLPSGVTREEAVPLVRRLLDEWLSTRLANTTAPANWELRESLDRLRSLQQLSSRP